MTAERSGPNLPNPGLVVTGPVKPAGHEIVPPSAWGRGSRLGEELPVFCEQCGYALHGLPPNRCGHCRILHFACPECGHHQPINTLRPAAQRILSRLRAWYLVVSVLGRLAFFGMGWMIWAAVGRYSCYELRLNFQVGGSTASYTPSQYSVGEFQIAAVWALVFAAVGRMMLLRWATSLIVGLGIMMTVTGAYLLGTGIRYWELSEQFGHSIPQPISQGYLLMLATISVSVMMGAVLVWPCWWLVVHLVFPRPLAEQLLNWMTFRPVTESLARD